MSFAKIRRCFQSGLQLQADEKSSPMKTVQAPTMADRRQNLDYFYDAQSRNRRSPHRGGLLARHPAAAPMTAMA